MTRPVRRVPELKERPIGHLMCPRCNTKVTVSVAQTEAGADLRCWRCGTEVARETDPPGAGATRGRQDAPN